MGDLSNLPHDVNAMLTYQHGKIACFRFAVSVSSLNYFQTVTPECAAKLWHISLEHQPQGTSSSVRWLRRLTEILTGSDSWCLCNSYILIIHKQKQQGTSLCPLWPEGSRPWKAATVLICAIFLQLSLDHKSHIFMCAVRCYLESGQNVTSECSWTILQLNIEPENKSRSTSLCMR